VHSVGAAPDGKVQAINIELAFLGIGGKLVASDSRITRAGDNVQLSMSAGEVSKLPEVRTD
jgi:hypothetical protein